MLSITVSLQILTISYNKLSRDRRNLRQLLPYDNDQHVSRDHHHPDIQSTWKNVKRMIDYNIYI